MGLPINESWNTVTAIQNRDELQHEVETVGGENYPQRTAPPSRPETLLPRSERLATLVDRDGKSSVARDTSITSCHWAKSLVRDVHRTRRGEAARDQAACGARDAAYLRQRRHPSQPHAIIPPQSQRETTGLIPSDRQARNGLSVSRPDILPPRA